MFSEEMYALGTKRSCIRELFEYGLKQKQIVGVGNVYDFSLGNPSVPAPASVNESIRTLLDTEDSLTLHGYSSAAGFADVKEAVARELAERFDFPVKPEELFFTCGAAPALTASIRALAVPDAEIIVIYPCFPEYKVFIENNGARMVAVPADEEHFQIRFDELEKCINENTQAVIINSPNNPSGVIYSLETLQKLSALLTKKSREYGKTIYIISDEPYRELVYTGQPVPFVPSVYKNTIVCYSYSKSLSLPGERIGYIYISRDADDGAAILAAAGGAARAAGHVCPPSLMQKVIALNTYTRPDLESYARNKDLLYDELTAYGYRCAKPEGAFYLFVKAPNGDAMEFSNRAKRKNLLVVPGDDFGCPSFFRLCTCVSYEMIQRSLPTFELLMEEYGGNSRDALIKDTHPNGSISWEHDL